MSTMSGGKRKSRKPQKWEDYVADEEQLASIEKELEKEEKARMQNLDDDDSNKERESEEDVKVEEEDVKEEKERVMSEDEMQLEIDMSRGEEDLGDCESRSKEDESEEELEDGIDAEQSTPPGESDQVIGECKSCGIQLRDWSSTQSHLRFHRLSHVPYCINWSSCVAPQTKRITCQVCQRHCQTKDVLAYHAYSEHYRGDLNTCPFCSTSFKNMKEFQEHLDFDTVSLRCHVCDVFVNEEHKYYQHVADCIAKKYPKATSVVCHICKKITEVFHLCDHLMQHSTLPNLSRYLAQKNRRRPVIPPKSENSRQQQSRFRPFLCEICDRRFVVYSEFKRHLYSHFKSRSFVCTYCGRSYCQKNTLIVHLYSYHNASLKAEEIIPTEDTNQRVCELCGRAGFLSDEFLIRHCILRCSQRNNLQLSFAAIVTSIAKKLNLCFSETLSHESMHTYLKLGLEAWEKPACVHELLESLLANKSVAPASPGGHRELIEFSDVQLLAYLDHFEEKNRGKDKDLEFLLNPRAKDGSPALDLPSLDEIQSKNHADMKRKGEGGMSGEDSLAASSVRSKEGEMNSQDSQGASYASGDTPLSDSPLNLRRLMQHLGKNGDKRKAGDGDEGGQIDICLVTSTTNTQVTITPAGEKAQDIKPPKVSGTHLCYIS
nr:zinc finger protein 652-like isoform X1 [Penaeus vannamei]XP_027221363.1 zinc finger protein 652-like isoform X1 [Penaeus vannamei]